MFNGEHVTIYKPARAINWTRTAAYEDSDDVITEVVSQTGIPA